MIRHCLRLIVLVAAPLVLCAQPPCHTKHLTIFDANLAEFLEERTLDLQSGPNTIEWRSLMPQTYIRTVRVMAGDGLSVVRQNVTYDGPEVRNQKSPVLHLVIQNAGSAGPRVVQIDYLAPGLSWKADYALLLDAHATSGPPDQMQLDGWMTVSNESGADICAASADLVAGEVQLLLPGAGTPRTFSANSQIANPGMSSMAPMDALAEVTGISVFTRVRLGSNIAMGANATIGRFPLFQHLKLPVEERHIFENEASLQTLGRGGFLLAPRGLEVRLVSRNQSASVFPAGMVTMYSQDDEVPQVVGQDQIPLTPATADFSITQGRSNLLQGTRRVVDRKTLPDPSIANRPKLVTQVEVVITNRGANATTAFVREGVEAYSGEWTISESSHPYQRLGDHMMEFRLAIPGNANVALKYTVEAH